jgi:hypothetical protein
MGRLKSCHLCVASIGGFFLLATGCGKERMPVEGTVTVNGQPLDVGGIDYISMEPDGSSFRCGGPIENGKYIIPADRGVYPGRYRVEIKWMKPTGKKETVSEGPADDGKEKKWEFVERKQALPAKYNERSELTADITSSENVVDFNLTP